MDDERPDKAARERSMRYIRVQYAIYIPMNSPAIGQWLLSMETSQSINLNSVTEGS